MIGRGTKKGGEFLHFFKGKQSVSSPSAVMHLKNLANHWCIPTDSRSQSENCWFEAHPDVWGFIYYSEGEKCERHSSDNGTKWMSGQPPLLTVNLSGRKFRKFWYYEWLVLHQIIWRSTSNAFVWRIKAWVINSWPNLSHSLSINSEIPSTYFNKFRCLLSPRFILDVPDLASLLHRRRAYVPYHQKQLSSFHFEGEG